MATIGHRESAVEETNGSVKAGLLMILTPGTLMNSYQKRWFVIVESQLNHELIFHTSETKADNKGRLNLDEVIEIRRDPIGKVSKSFSKGPDEELRFEIACEGKVFELAAMSRSEKVDWLAVLSRVCELPIEGSDDVNSHFAHQGNLLKQSGGGKRNKVWAQRFFTLRTEGPKAGLSYYSGPKESSLKGTILLEDVTEVRAWSKNDGTEQPSLSARFELVTHARTYVLATTETGASDDKESWMEKIASSCSVEISRTPAVVESKEAAPADTKYSGWLSKQGGGTAGLKNWKSRFFVLTPEKLMYFTDATLSDLKGEVVVASIQSIVPFSQVRRECGIELVTPDRVYVLAADSSDAKGGWVDAIAAVAGVAPETVKFPGCTKGWLWKKPAKGAAFQRHLFVLAEEQVKEKRFSIANFSGVPPPPPASDGSDDPAAPAPPPPPKAAVRSKTKLRLLAFSDEGCNVQTAGLGSTDIQAVVLQEYGSLASSASPYLNWRLEVVSASLGTWVLAADTEAERTRWLDEFKKVGIAFEDKRPSQQKWDFEGLLQTRKQNASLGWKERYVRLAGTRFIVFREQSSQVIKETIDTKSVYLETIKVKESGGTFRFRLYLGHEDDNNFMDWATTTEKLRGEWIKHLLASGCKVASSDSQVEERARCDVLEKRALEVSMGACLTDFQGDVSILKATRNVLASSYKKRFARLRGCRFSWAHYEESQDIDGLLCIDNQRWRLHVYHPGADKLWPFVLKPAEGLEAEDVIFVVGSEELRNAWVAALVNVLEHGQVVGVKYVNSVISTSLAPAKDKLEAAEKKQQGDGSDGSVEALREEVARIEAEITREQGNTYDDFITVHDEALEHEKPDVRVTKKETKKKRTFGKRRGDVAAKRNTVMKGSIAKRGSARMSGVDEKEEEEDGALLVEPVEKLSVAAKKEEVKKVEVKPIVLPPQDERAEAKPEPVYPKNVVLDAGVSDTPPQPSVSASSDGPVEASADAPKAATVSTAATSSSKNFSTGEGFVFHGRWTFDWLDLLSSEPLSAAPTSVTLAPPPEALAYRTDMGANAQLVRCY